MVINITFEYETLDFTIISNFLSIIEQFGIYKIELSRDNNLLKKNPITNKKIKEIKRQKFGELQELIKEIKDSRNDDYTVYIYSKNMEFTINSKCSLETSGLNNSQLHLFDEFIKLENLLTFSIYNDKDCLLESMNMNIGLLNANNHVHLYPGYKLIINEKIIPNIDEFINKFKPKELDNKFELTFSNSSDDITIKNEMSNFLSFLGKNKYKKSTCYNSQVDFVNYLLENDVIKQQNKEFENLGFLKYKDEFQEKKGLTKQTFYLDQNGNSISRKFSTYEYDIIFNKDGTHSYNLKHIIR